MKTIRVSFHGSKALCKVAPLAVALFGAATVGRADLITSSPTLPPDGVYLGNAIPQIYGGPAMEFLLSLPVHTPNAATAIRMVGGGIGPGTPGDEIETFGSNFNALREIKLNGVSQGPPQPIFASGPVMTLVFGKIGNTTGTFDTEMLQMDLSGPGFMIRESPTRASTGRTTIADIGGGLFRIDSFFDVFTELSLDGGETWMPGHDAAGAPLARHIVLFDANGVPEVSTWTAGLVLVGIASLGWRRRRQVA